MLSYYFTRNKVIGVGIYIKTHSSNHVLWKYATANSNWCVERWIPQIKFFVATVNVVFDFELLIGRRDPTKGWSVAKSLSLLLRAIVITFANRFLVT